jgi:hypothetical protein
VTVTMPCSLGGGEREREVRQGQISDEGDRRVGLTVKPATAAVATQNPVRSTVL